MADHVSAPTPERRCSCSEDDATECWRVTHVLLAGLDPEECDCACHRASSDSPVGAPTPERMAEIRAIREAARQFGSMRIRWDLGAKPEQIRLVTESPQIIDELLARLDDYDAREVRLDADGNEILQAQSECPHHAPTASRCLTCMNRALHHAMLDNLALHKELQSARADAERIDWLEQHAMRDDFEDRAGIRVERFMGSPDVQFSDACFRLREWGDTPLDHDGELDYSQRLYRQSDHATLREAIDAARTSSAPSGAKE